MKKNKPFFAKFLESQLTEETKKEVKGGDISTTAKYPSDAEDGGIFTLPNLTDVVDPISVTLKYPSDLEDR